MNVLKKSVKPRWEESLAFEQRMLLNQFRVRTQISYLILFFGLGSLLFDIGVARRLSPWITSIVGFIIGWWMPSPGQQPQQTNQNLTEINRPFVAIQGGESDHP